MTNLYEENMKLIDKRNKEIYELKKARLDKKPDSLTNLRIAEKFSISEARVGQIYSAYKLKLLENDTKNV